MKVKSTILLLIGFLLSMTTFGQSVSDVFKKLNTQYTNSKPLQYATKYSLYKDYQTKVVSQSYNGSFMKTATNVVYMKIDDTEFINGKQFSVKINHKEKAMDVSNKPGLSTAEFDMNKLLVLCKIVSYKDYKVYWEIVMTPGEYSGLTYSKIVLNINKNFTIQKQVFYYNTEVNFSTDYKKQNLSMPRLEIVYSNYNNNPVDSSKMNVYSFFSISKNNKITATAKYKDYEVSDVRTNVSNKK